jgi:hypothetical protein
MRPSKLIHTINKELLNIIKQLSISDNVIELLKRRDTLLNRKDICERHLFLFKG